MNAPVSRAAEGLARRAFTVAEVRRMVEVGLIPEDERLEILGGEIVPMSPKGAKHEAIKRALNRLWGRRDPRAHEFIPEAGLYLDEHTYLEPDFIVYQASIAWENLRGPDILLAVEVADSSLAYDLGKKAHIYADFGVRELWVIDAKNLLTHVHIHPAAGGYRTKKTMAAAELLQPTEAPLDFAFALKELERR
jgi:Uma2 family endonuclease